MKKDGIRSLSDIFFAPKAVLILKVLHESGGNISESELHIRSLVTYSHICKIIEELVGIGILNTKKDGRKLILSFTDKGEKYANKLIEVYRWQL